MKRITLTFMILLSVFFTIWGVKMKHPINRPENVKEDTETPWYETKYQAPKADDEWSLDPEIPLNYIPVPFVFLYFSDWLNLRKFIVALLYHLFYLLSILRLALSFTSALFTFIPFCFCLFFYI